MAFSCTNPNADIAGVAATGNVATYTVVTGSTAISIGTASADRMIVVLVGTELAASTPTQCQIDYGSGYTTMLAGLPGTQGAINSHLFYLPVATGTTANFKVTFGATNPTAAQNHIAVYVATGASLTPYDLGFHFDTDADPIDTNVSAQGGPSFTLAGGGLLAVCVDATDTTTRTWANPGGGGVTKGLDVASASGGFRFSTGVSTTGDADNNYTVSGGNNEDGATSWIGFLPASDGTFGSLIGGAERTATIVANPFKPSWPLEVSVGDLIAVLYGEQATTPTATACADNLGNNYTQLNSGTSITGAGGLAAFFSVCTTAGHCTPSITTTASANLAETFCLNFTGPWAASPLDKNTATHADAAQPYETLAAGILAQADEMLLGYFGFGVDDDSSTATPAGAVFNWETGRTVATSLVVSSTASVTMGLNSNAGTTNTNCLAASFKKATAGAQDGQGRFNAVGNFSIDADLGQLGAASFLDGGSAISAYANLNAVIQSTFSGSGNISADSFKFKTGAITFAGIGSFAAYSIKYKSGETTLSGNGNLSIYLSQGNQAAAIFGGIGNLNGAVVQGISGAVRFNGFGNFSVDATQVSAGGEVQQGSTTLIGSGSLNSLAVLNQIAQTRFNGIGNLQTLAFDVGQIVSTFSGSGNLTSPVTQNRQAAAFFIGNGSLSINAQLAQNAFATFGGSGTLSIYANLRMQATAIFGGLGNLSIAYQTASNEIQATFAGTGSLSAYASQGNIAAATLGGSGNLSSVAQGASPARAVFAGASNLSVLTSLNEQASALFSGIGLLSITARLALPAFVTFAGSGNLTATTRLGMTVSARFGGIGNLFADGAQAGIQFGAVTLNGTGNLSAYTLSALQAAVRLNAVGSLLSNQIKYKLISATFAGNSSLSATYTIVKYGEVRFDGASALFASTISAQAASAIFSGESFMRAQATGGRTRRVPTRGSISKLAQDARPDQAQDNRSDQTQTNRRLKTSHG